jgi:hypothetical protein
MAGGSTEGNGSTGDGRRRGAGELEELSSISCLPDMSTRPLYLYSQWLVP